MSNNQNTPKDKNHSTGRAARRYERMLSTIPDPQETKMFNVLIGYNHKNLKNIPKQIPWSMLNEEQAQHNHTQTLTRLNERGGMCVTELLANIQRQSRRDWTVTQVAVDELNKLVTDFLTPQDNVPQGKSVENLANEYYEWKKANHGNPEFINYHSTIKDFIKGYDSSQSRIAELERNEQSDAKYIASLEKQIESYVEIIDWHIISSANYTADYVDNVIAENARYREALEKIKKEALYPSDFSGSCYKMIVMVEQALNP